MATPQIVTKSQLAGELGVSKPRVTQWIALGLPVLPDGRVDLEVAKTWVSNNIARSDRPMSPGYAEARLANLVYKAKLLRLEFERRNSRLVEAAAVRVWVGDALDTLREGVLGLSDQLAAPIAAESDARKVRLLLKDALTQELTRLADAIAAV